MSAHLIKISFVVYDLLYAKISFLVSPSKLIRTERAKGLKIISCVKQGDQGLVFEVWPFYGLHASFSLTNCEISIDTSYMK